MRNITRPIWFQRAKEQTQTLGRHMTTREKNLLALFVVALVISAIFIVTGYVRRHSTLLPQVGGSYDEAAVGQPRHINPILAGANDIDLDISNLIYSPLFQLNNDFELEANLATGYEVSDNNLEYTISLRDDVLWHDDQPFTADDVVFTIRSIQTPDYGSPLESSFQGVRIEKIDDHTVLFKLNQPYAPFLTNLTVGIVPKHVWESIEPQNAALAEQMLKPVGTGPFQFEELVSRRKTGEITSFRMVRNEHYYGQQPYLDEFTFHFYPTNEEAVQALLSGTVDGVSFLPLDMRDNVESRNTLTVHRLLLPQYFALFFNEIKNEILGDAGVRAALTLSVDRERIVSDALKGEAHPLHVPIPPGMFKFDSELSGPTLDPQVARQNLEEAGWRDEDGDGIREKDSVRLEVTITTTDWPEFVHTAELIKQQWEDIGVAVSIESVGAGAIQQTVVGPREYQILLYGEILQTDPDPYPFWHSTQTRSPGLNLSLFKDKNVDKLLEEARKTSDNNERREKYVQFLQRFSDLNPAIILYQPYYLYAQHRAVRGQTMNKVNLPVSRFNDVENWHVKVKRIWNGLQEPTS